MKLSQNETYQLIKLVIKSKPEVARENLNRKLKAMRRSEGQFYESVIEFSPTFKLPSEDWFLLLSRLPTRMLRAHLNLRKILSETELNSLPPEKG